jgi:fused signal recognition particle receptor
MANWNPFARKKKIETESPAAPPQAPQQPSSEPVQPSLTSTTVHDAAEAKPETPVDRNLSTDAVVSANEAQIEPVKPKRTIFGRFKDALKKTVQVLNTDIRDLIKEGRLVDDEFLEELYRYRWRDPRSNSS